MNKVPVFESELEEETREILAKLTDAGVQAEMENSPMRFPYPPDQKTFKLLVDLRDEAKAFEVIDSVIQK